MERTRLVAWSWVGLQGVLLALIVLLPFGDHWRVSTALEVVGRALEGVGLVLGIWGAMALGSGLTPSPLPNGRIGLVSRGPYRWVRHPIYTAVMAFMGGVVVLGGSWWPAVVWAFLVGVLFFKSQWEERHLVDAFPGYREYATAVGRFLPRVSQSRSSGARPPGGVWE